MRDVPNSMIHIWQSGDFTGRQRAMARVTVQQADTQLYNHSFPIMAATKEEITRRKEGAGGAIGMVDVDTSQKKVKDNGTNTYASTIFGSRHVPVELPNLKSVSWTRSVDSDVAEATFEFYNSKVQMVSYREEDGSQRMVPIRDEMGFYTFNRGSTNFDARWSREPNEYLGLLVPDNILRTYEGYGYDPEAIPERDANLVQTGVWLIDQVDMSAEGIIRVTARDPARLLMDHMAFLPVIPPDFYPLSFHKVEKTSGNHKERTYKATIKVKGEEATDIGVITEQAKPTPRYKRVRMTYLRCSDDARRPPRWIDYKVVKGDYLIKLARRYKVPGGWREIAAANEDVFEARGNLPKDPHWIYPGQIFRIPIYGEGSRIGNMPSDAFDTRSGTYWQSDGFPIAERNRSYATEWIEGKLGNVSVSQVRFTMGGAGYVVYVSVRSNGSWVNIGRGHVLKTVAEQDGTKGIPYVEIGTVPRAGREVTITLDKTYPKVDRIRLTFRNLAPIPNSNPKRVGVMLRSFTAYTNARPAPPAKIIPTLPGYRGVTDSFGRSAPPSTRKWYGGLGVTKEKDPWNAALYTIRPWGSAARKVIKTLPQTLRDNSYEAAFIAALVDLKIRPQVVTIHTGYVKNGNDPDSVSPGRWCIVLRAQGHSNGIRIYIDSDRSISVQLHSSGPTGDVLLPVDDASDLGDYRVDLQRTPHEIVASLIGSELVIYTRRLGDDPEPELVERIRKTDKRFDGFKGTEAGFALGNYSSAITYFEARTKYRRGIHDTFTRRNNPDKLGKASSGQVWKHPAKTWSIDNNDAYLRADNAKTPLAIAEMFDSAQDVVISMGSMGSVGTAVIALRVADSANAILVRFSPGEVAIQTRVSGKNTVQATATTPAFTPGVDLRAKVVEGTVTVWHGATMVLSDTKVIYGDEAFGYHVGFGSSGAGARVQSFTAKSLGADDEWIYEGEVTVPAHFEPGAGAKPGTYEDFTDIVKLFCAWGGFYWPRDAALVDSGGTEIPLRPAEPDAVLGTSDVGRVWGDFESTGTAGPAPLDWSIWDKKSLMDGIVYVREILGYLFYVDETGGVVWRAPNIYEVGNYVSSFSENPRRTNYAFDIDEKRTLIGLRTALNSRNVRERVFVANVSATQAGMAAGFNPNDIGLRRVAGWTDQHFNSAEECQVMADMITLRQLFRYRSSAMTIPAMPAIQIDDQVRVWEGVTNEGYLHYVRGISSTNDLEAGGWVYELETHWLGDEPFGTWAFDASTFPEETQAYIDALRLKSGVGTTNYYELPRKDTAVLLPIKPSPHGETQDTVVTQPEES